MAKKYYAVKIGRCCGIFLNLQDYQKQINGFPGSKGKAFNNILNAEAYLLSSNVGKIPDKAGKYYAVKVGRNCGIYTNKSEYLRQVNGFPNAEGKSFKTEAEAKAYLESKSKSKKKKKKKQKQKKKNNTQAKPEACMDELTLGKRKKAFLSERAIAYVDGSFNGGYYSGAALIMYDNNEIVLAKQYKAHKSSLQNVAGEIMGAVLAIKYCYKNNINSLCIHHDYEGIANWANGNTKAKKALPKKYREFVEKARNRGMKISFVKVKAHSGDKYNNAVDKIAKDVLNHPEEYKSS